MGRGTMSVRRNIRLLDYYNVLVCVLPIMAVIVPFYQHQIGLTFQQFLIGEAVFAATVVAMEIPTGWLSDVWKRKHTLALAATISGLGMTMIGFADSFLMAVSAQAVIGVGISLSSGTTSALLYDSMLESGESHNFRRFEGKRHAMGMYTLGLTSIGGGFLYEVDPYLPVWISAITYFMAVPVALFMLEPDRHKEAIRKNPFYDMMQVMKYSLHGHKEVAALIFFVAIMFGSTQAGMWMQQPYYAYLGIPEAWFGVLVSAGLLLGGIGSHLGHMMERYFQPVHILVGLWICATLFWVISGALPGYHALGMLLISNAAWGIAFPLIQDTINQQIDSSRRATVLSVSSLMIRFVFIPLGFGIGWVVDHHGIDKAFIALAAFVFFANLLNVRKLLTSLVKSEK